MRHIKPDKRGMLPIMTLIGIMILAMFVIVAFKACKKLDPKDIEINENEKEDTCPEIAWQDMPGKPECDDYEDCEDYALDKGITRSFQSKCVNHRCQVRMLECEVTSIWT